LEAKEGVDADAGGGSGPDAQMTEDIRIGNMFAKALTDSLVAELRNRGIDAYREADAAPPGPDTASIKGRFLRADGSMVTGFGLSASRARSGSDPPGDGDWLESCFRRPSQHAK
jgi:hypothetical protein